MDNFAFNNMIEHAERAVYEHLREKCPQGWAINLIQDTARRYGILLAAQYVRDPLTGLFFSPEK